MSRRREVVKRKSFQDPKHNDKVVAKSHQLCIMRSGKKSTAAGGLRLFDIIQGKTKDEPVKVLRKLDNVKPVLEVKSRRVGGATYQVPVGGYGGQESF